MYQKSILGETAQNYILFTKLTENISCWKKHLTKKVTNRSFPPENNIGRRQGRLTRPEHNQKTHLGPTFAPIQRMFDVADDNFFPAACRTRCWGLVCPDRPKEETQQRWEGALFFSIGRPPDGDRAICARKGTTQPGCAFTLKVQQA